MPPEAYAAVDWEVRKIGSVDCYVDRAGTLLGIPNLATFDAPIYLKVAPDGHGRLVVTIERRTGAIN